MTQFNLGIIEGFFGKPWSWQARCNAAQFLKQNAYNFYLYAPKADQHLRQNWREDWPQAELEALIQLGEVYHHMGLKWGIGLSPFEIYLNYDADAIAALETKIQALNRLNLDIFAILFDDMRGDAQELSRIQVDIVHRVAALSHATSFIMCPTYYSDDPILEKLFGQKPDQYLQDLGKQLDPTIDVFWTGPKVCSTAYPEAHLQDVGDRLGRKPFLWDNYPVNDGAKLSLFLHLKAFENRPAEMAQWVSGHGVNPMNQPHLSQIPLMTLPMSYQRQGTYSPTEASVEAVTHLCAADLADAILEDIALFQDQGLEKLSSQTKTELIQKYTTFDSPYAIEIVQWLQGEFKFDPACLTG